MLDMLQVVDLVPYIAFGPLDYIWVQDHIGLLD